MSTNSDEDLKKAISFLLEKEMRDYSLEKKKEFLLKKLSPEIVDKALILLPTIESNVNERIDDYKKYSKKGFLDSFFDLGIISSVLLATLGINYIIDLNRNKKNDLFYKEIEKKINDELRKNTEEMNNDISNKLNSFVTNESLNEKINSQLITYTQQRGLNLNLSSKSLKDNMATVRNDMNILENKVKELNVKLENNNLLLKQEMTKEIINVIEENNKKLLYQIIEHQNKLILSFQDKDINIANKETEKNLINTSPMVKKDNSIIQENNNEQLTFSEILNDILSSISDSNIKFNFLSQIRVYHMIKIESIFCNN
jgi:hypothetical protein